ncbi:Uncharacterised protein [uncultured archaeon]|nr:Uncharacterised protein [uncultured archaeon]
MPIEPAGRKPKNAKPEAYLPNRRRFLERRKQGWHFKQLKILGRPDILPWEKKLLVKALPIVMEYEMEGRKIDETNESVSRIMPIAAQEVKQELQRQLPPQQYEKVSRFLDYYSGKFSEIFMAYAKNGSFSAETMRIARETGKDLLKATYVKLGESSIRIFSENNERPEYQQTYDDFSYNIEYRLKHDCFFALHESGNFIRKLKEAAF